MKNQGGAPRGNVNGRGNRGIKRTPAQIAAMSERAKGHQVSEEVKKKLSSYWTGRKRPGCEGVKHWNWKGGLSERLKQKTQNVRPTQCQVCKRSGKIVYDHCHKTGLFRGWLCNNCNVALGFAGDSAEKLRALAQYLEK